jgi:16S rRNA (cytidine1402-2'-O)-methyltransferase
MVATPLGNLQDLSPRALATLRAADLIAAEDTRRARKLLSHFQVHRPLESYHGDSGPQKADRLLRRLRAGQAVAYVTDGGTPGISDPGAELAAAAAAEGFPVVPIPGPSAVAAALSVAGFTADRFVFAGFPPARHAETHLRPLLARGDTLVLYESPHRLHETLGVLAEVAPDRAMVIGREVTKQYEEWLRGSAAELARRLADVEPRGEYVLVLGPVEAVAEPAAALPPVTTGLRRMLAAGVSVRDSAEIIAALGLLGRREAYQLALSLKKEDALPEAK